MITTTFKKNLLSAAIAMSLVALAGCGDKDEATETKTGQALASVNGEEITVMQLNEEMMRANVQPQQQEAARKQLLQVLIDRTLLEEEAEKEKLDRDPKVVQAVERAKSLIIAQAWLQKHVGNVPKPTRQEVEAYYNQNPQFFTNRQQFNMAQVSIAARDYSDEVKAAADSAKSLDEMAAFLDSKGIRFGRGEMVRTTSDLPAAMSGRLAQMDKGKLFIVKELDRTLFLTLNDVKDAPVALNTAAPQIEQFLLNKKNKEAAEAQLARLRTAAKVEYLNGAPPGPATPAGAPGATATAAAPAATAVAAAPEAAQPADAAIARGVSDLK